MKQIWHIFKRDVRRLCQNRFALIVTIGIIIIPSLYAWFNIGANYDPYSNTKDIRVAVSNEDKGTRNTVSGELNAGDEIIKNLKENDQLGWTFVDKDKAVEGVKSGKYYAAIIIPDDFSARLTDFLSGKIEKSEIVYYVNEKKNAIAPKITDTGAQTTPTRRCWTASRAPSQPEKILSEPERRPLTALKPQQPPARRGSRTPRRT